MNEYFDDGVFGLITSGVTAITQKNASVIDTTITALQAEIQKQQGNIDYWRDLDRQDIVDELTLIQNIARQFVTLFNVYFRYLTDTGGTGTPPYTDWADEYNSFLGVSPKTIVSGSQLPSGTNQSSLEYGTWQKLKNMLTTGQTGTPYTQPPPPQGMQQRAAWMQKPFTLPIDNAKDCMFYIETREVDPGGTRSIVIGSNTYTIKNPTVLEFKLHRCCNVKVPKVVDQCGNCPTGTNQKYKANERHIIIDWTRLVTGKLSYTLQDCQGLQTKKVNYNYWYDSDEVWENFLSITKNYNIVVPDGQNEASCAVDMQFDPEDYPYSTQSRQFSLVNLQEHLISRTIDPTVYSKYPNNRGRELRGAYATSLGTLCTEAYNKQFVSPHGDIGELIGSKKGMLPDNFDRIFAYASPKWFDYTNIGFISHVEAVYRGNTKSNPGSISISEWYSNASLTNEFELISDIQHFDNPIVERTSWPYVDPLSSNPNDRLYPLVPSVKAKGGGEIACQSPNITPTGYDCNRPFSETRGFNWILKESPVNVFRDIEDFSNAYNQSTKRFVGLTDNNTFDGSVKIASGQIFKIFDGGGSVLRFNNFTDVPNIQVPGKPCFVGTERTYKIDIKRQQKVYIKLECNAWGEIPYFSKPTDVPKAAGDSRFDNSDFTGNAGIISRGPYVTQMVKGGAGTTMGSYPGAILEESTGQWYIYKEVFTPFLDGNGNRDFKTILGNTISLNKNGVGCQPSREECARTEPQVDPNNVCGCTEFIIETCDDVYDSFTYTDFMDRQTHVKEYRIAKEFPADPQYRWLRATERIYSTVLSGRPECNPSPVRMHHPFLFGADVLTGIKKNIVFGLFNGMQSPTCYLTSSVQPTASKEYYYDITDCDSCTTNPYYAIAYGHYEGSGSTSIGYDYSDSATKAIYSQYRLLALEHPETRFKFYDVGTETTPKGIYAINFYRDGLSHRLDPGNFQINLAGLSGSAFANNVHTGSNVQISGSNPTILSLIDNSGDIDESKFCLEDPYSYYDIVSGSLSNGVHNSGTGSILTNTNITTYGRVYPNIGVVILNGDKFDSILGFNSVTGSNIAGDNAWKIHTSISGAAALGQPIKARNVRTKTTNHYFVRVPTTEANYSTNPTYVLNDGEKRGHLKYECFVNDPVTYITSVGLYNDKTELLAVAKLSRPIQKTPDNDVLIKIRLNW